MSETPRRAAVRYFTLVRTVLLKFYLELVLYELVKPKKEPNSIIYKYL